MGLQQKTRLNQNLHHGSKPLDSTIRLSNQTKEKKPPRGRAVQIDARSLPANDEHPHPPSINADRRVVIAREAYMNSSISSSSSLLTVNPVDNVTPPLRALRETIKRSARATKRKSSRQTK